MALTTDDIVAIQQLEAYCHHACEDPDLSKLELVFTKDAVFDGRQTGNPGPIFHGIEEIKGFFAWGKPPHPPAHQQTNCFVYEDGDVVRVKMKYMCMNTTGTKWYGGDSDDVVVKTPDGWRVKERVAMVRFGTPGAE
jgi:hypothetical protein